MADKLTFHVTITADDAAPQDISLLPAAEARFIQCAVDQGTARSAVSIHLSGVDEFTSPERSGSDFDEVPAP